MAINFETNDGYSGPLPATEAALQAALIDYVQARGSVDSIYDTVEDLIGEVNAVLRSRYGIEIEPNQ